MKYENLRAGLPNTQLQTVNNSLPHSDFSKAIKQKNDCKLRTANGFCTHNNRQRTATLFTVISNN